MLHLAAAMSASDLHRIVSERLPPDAKKPSVKWLLLQFAPKDPTCVRAMQHTGALDVRFAVQSRQWRFSHQDDHYAAASFKYLRHLAIRFRNHTTMVCVDDNHHCKVGEPGYPLAAVERGKKVVVGVGKIFAVGDHDFAKCSLTPSVALVCNVPEDIGGTFFAGRVHVGLKDAAFEPSSLLCAMPQNCPRC